MTVSVPVLPLRWLTFVRVPISSFETLKRRRPNTRDGAVEPIAVKVAVRYVAEHDLPLAFNVRGLYSCERNTVFLGWRAPGKRRTQPRSSSIVASADERYLVLEMSGHIVLIRAFRTEIAAKAWGESRRAHTLPEWE